MAMGDVVQRAPRNNNNNNNNNTRTSSSSRTAAPSPTSSSLCASDPHAGRGQQQQQQQQQDDNNNNNIRSMDAVPLMESDKPTHGNGNRGGNSKGGGGRFAAINTTKRWLHRVRLLLQQPPPATTTTTKTRAGAGSQHHHPKRSNDQWRWRRFRVALLAAALFGLWSRTDTGREVLHQLGIRKMAHQERFKMKLNASLALKEKETQRRHQPPRRRRPWEELVLEKESRTDILQTLLREELQKMPSVPFISWGVYHLYRMCFPPELHIPNIKGHEEQVDGQPPAIEKLRGDQILIAHRVPNPKRLDYSIPHWEHRIEKDRVRNIGIYLMGDEFDYGSAFLNEYADGRAYPFSYVVRDYYFDPLKNARHTRVVPLGTMTCQKKKLACRVGPPDVVFYNMLPSAVKVELRPPAIQPASRRTRRCYWAGSDRNDRREMVAYFEQNGGCDVYLTPGFNQGHNKTVYADILADSVFGLIPSGNSPETHRLAEVLMFGGIPAMLDRDAAAAFLHSYAEPIPMVTGRNWKQVHQRMQALSSDDLDKLQQKVLQWWDHHWNCVHDDLRWILAQSHARSEGRDLCSRFHTEVEKRLQWLRWGRS